MVVGEGIIRFLEPMIENPNREYSTRGVLASWFQKRTRHMVFETIGSGMIQMKNLYNLQRNAEMYLYKVGV